MRSRPSLPHDLFHSHIIPDILSEHLHLLLVQHEPPNWHPFYILPLVSLAFRESCQSLYMAIFGQETCANGSLHDDLESVWSLWIQAKLPPEQLAPPHHNYGFRELMSQKTLIRVYMCIAIAQSFLNYDVICPLDRQRAASEFSGGEQTVVENHSSLVGYNPALPVTRRFRMMDDNMHRVYMPLTCATKLCDSIVPARLAYKVSEYLADIIPMFSTLPVMLKYTQDLESCVAVGHMAQTETYFTWTLQTLCLIERCDGLVKELQAMGHIVDSFKKSSFVPTEVVIATNITKALHNVVDKDWGAHSEEIHGRASALLQQWINCH